MRRSAATIALGEDVAPAEVQEMPGHGGTACPAIPSGNRVSLVQAGRWPGLEAPAPPGGAPERRGRRRQAHRRATATSHDQYLARTVRDVGPAGSAPDHNPLVRLGRRRTGPALPGRARARRQPGVGPRRTPAGSGLRDRRSRGARARPAHLSRTRNRSRVELLTAVMRHYQQITGRQLSADRVMAGHLHNALGDALWRSEAGIPLQDHRTPPE